MKNILVIAALLIAGTIAAQTGNNEGKDQRPNRSPEQVATLKSKKLTLALDLTDQQQKAVYELALQEAESVKERPTREAAKNMSADQKMELQSQRLDKRIAAKREMNNILTPEQYAKWEVMMTNRVSKRQKMRFENRPRKEKKLR
jgi:Spy/CpxP family protein refolding chaperone